MQTNKQKQPTNKTTKKLRKDKKTFNLRTNKQKHEEPRKQNTCYTSKDCCVIRKNNHQTLPVIL